jgi:nucleoside-diphosphate-sugar epimerase
MSEPICIYGGTGFVGSVFAKMFPNTIVQGRDELIPQTRNLINFVSTTDNYNVFDAPTLDIAVNEVFMIEVLEEARKKYGDLFTFNMISSWFVYGDTEQPSKETSPCNPKGFYSITKRAAEQLLISYCETHGIHWRILRLANVLGIEDKKVSAKKNAIQFLIRRIINDEPIGLYNGGNFIRDYIDVRDACFAINGVITKGKVNEIYNISNGVPLKFIDLINMAIDIMEKQEPYMQSVPPSEFHKIVQVENMVLDNTKLKELGYRPRYSIKDTISRIVYHYKNEHKQG